MKNQCMARAIIEILTLSSRTSSFTRSLCSSSSTTATTSTSSFSIKNVTKSNFDSVLRDLRPLVREADFVAIDLELTGVKSAPWRESFEFDDSDIRYLKVKDSAEKFAVVQFGVCPFRWDPSKQSFVAHPHNFFVFPRQEISVDGPTREFLCQTSSIEFLARYQFDFNACIREGISYLSRQQEGEALICLNCEEDLTLSSLCSKENKDTGLAKVADVLFTERVKNIIHKWREGLVHDGNGQNNFHENDSQQQFQTIFFKMRPALKLNGFTSHQLRLIQLVTLKHFKDLAYVRVTGEASCLEQLIVYTDSNIDRDLLMSEVKSCLHEAAETKIRAAIGFRHVIDLLSSEQKLIVGHNCFLDIAHVYSKFFGPLPATLEEYVSSVHECFPYIIDTKVLLNGSYIFQHLMKKRFTSLSKAFALLCPQPASGFTPRVKVEVQVDDMRSSSWNSGAKHEAGYDAFMTGCVFTQACSHLGVDFHSAFSKLVHDARLQKYINLLYLSWSNGDVIDLSTGECIPKSSVSSISKGKYSKIVFSNIVVVWGFVSKLKAIQIRECISKAFGSTSVTSIHHLDETAVFIQFSDEELVSRFLELKETLESSHNPNSVLSPLYRILEGRCTCAASYDVYKEICSSPISEILFAKQAEAVGIERKRKHLESTSEPKTQDDGSFGKDKIIQNSRDSYPNCKTQEIKHVLNTLDSDNNSLTESYLSLRDELINSVYFAEAQLTK